MLSIGDILPPFATLTAPLFPTQCLPIHNLHPRHFFAAIMYITPPPPLTQKFLRKDPDDKNYLLTPS